MLVLTQNGSFSRQCRKYVREYSEITGIHGLRYITEKRTRFEKLYWICLLIASLCGCLYMICEILDKYAKCPVVVSFGTQSMGVYEVPFPSVTICPESKCSNKKFNYTDAYLKIYKNRTIDDQQLNHFHYLSLLCDDGEFEMRPGGPPTIGTDFFKVLEKFKPAMKMMCYFMGELFECTDLFTLVIIDEGICYSFNVLDRDEIFKNTVVYYGDYYRVPNTSRDFNYDEGYTNRAQVKTYPRRALMSGADNALEIYLYQNSDDADYICNKYLQGFRVVIHNAWEVPRATKYYFRVPFDKSVVAAIEPELIITSSDIKDLDPGKRQCYLINERSLEHFTVYSESNCLLECLTNYTLGKCGCVSYFMPRKNGTSICGYGSFKCLIAAEAELKSNILQSKILDETHIDYIDCDCKQSCTARSYHYQVSQSEFFWKDYFQVHPQAQPNIINKEHWSVLSVYLKPDQFLPLERHKLYGMSDLISNLGGLLGLFTGFSLLSIAELLYFVTLRIWCNKKMYGAWSGHSTYFVRRDRGKKSWTPDSSTPFGVENGIF